MKQQRDDEVYGALQEVLQFYNIEVDSSPEEESGQRKDYGELISKTQDKLDDLTLKAEEIYQRTGMTRQQLEAYASNPNNFSKEQWEMLEKVRFACEKYKQEAIRRIDDGNFEEMVAKQKEKKQLGRFAKKKHWIPS